MENLPERPQSPHAHLRASDADRDQVIEVLGNALAHGQLTPDEHSDRLDAVYSAKTLGELEPITYDLQVQPVRPAQASTSTTPGSGIQPAPVDVSGASDDTDSMIAIFSGVDRKGRWRVRRRSRSVLFFGGVSLDLTEAVFDAPVVELEVNAMFGGVDVTVPDGVEVRNQFGGVFSGVSIEDREPPPPGAPVLVLRGVGIFSGISVSRPKRKKLDKKRG